MIYDVAIIGAGPAGLSAGIYASRARLSTVIIEKKYTGGQAAITDRIENYPGFADGIDGGELTDRIKLQADKFGAVFFEGDVNKIEKKGCNFIIYMEQEKLEAKSVILAMGAYPRKTGAKGETEFVGRGISYCATCDGAFYTDKSIILVGGGDTAIEETIYLTRFAKNIHVVHRRDQLRATKILQERAFNNKKVKFVWNSVIDEYKGIDVVEEVTIKNIKTGELCNVSTDGIFIAVGYIPNTDFIKDFVTLDGQGYIITDDCMRTSIPGVFAAGDIRMKPLRQVVTAVADGAIAAVEAERFIEGQ